MNNWYTGKRVNDIQPDKGGVRHNNITRKNSRGFITWVLVIILGLVYINMTHASELKSEDDYVQKYCRGYPGDSNPLPDGTRPDCIWDDYTIEYDWATFKWYECITQAKWYAMNTGRRAGCVLIQRFYSDIRYIDRAKRLIMHYNEPVTLWVLRNGKFIKVNTND